MANEILKDEVLSEEELDKVAGGSVRQVASDSQFLRDSGAVPLKGWGNHAVKNNFELYSGAVVKAWEKVGITCTPSANGDNVYSKDGKEISRWQAYQTVAEKTGFPFKPTAYGFPTNDPSILALDDM